MNKTHCSRFQSTVNLAHLCRRNEKRKCVTRHSTRQKTKRDAQQNQRRNALRVEKTKRLHETQFVNQSHRFENHVKIVKSTHSTGSHKTNPPHAKRGNVNHCSLRSIQSDCAFFHVNALVCGAVRILFGRASLLHFVLCRSLTPHLVNGLWNFCHAFSV